MCWRAFLLIPLAPIEMPCYLPKGMHKATVVMIE